MRKRIEKIIVSIIFVTMILISVNKVKAAEELPDNGGKISSAQVIQTKTGTGPFDDNDEPGNDSSENNNIVRSFDQVTWTIENTMVLNDDEVESYTGGRIYFEATLPENVKGKIVWKTDSINWAENMVVSQDKSKITGYYTLSKDDLTVPGKQSLFFIVDVLDALNGTEFQPEFKFWLNGNEERDYVKITAPIVKVSAAPSYNIKLSRNSNCYERSQKDYGKGNVYGRTYGYAVILQLYNVNASKGLKGIEFPKGDITFDIDLKLERTEFDSTERVDITKDNVILWNYKINANTKTGNIANRSMATSVVRGQYADSSAPLGVVSSNRNSSVFNSGNISMEQNDNKLSVTISDYAIDGIFPKYNVGYVDGSTIVYGDNVGCFSVGFFQLFVPDTEDTIIDNRNYYLSLSISNFLATSLSGIETTSQARTNDDSNSLSHVRYSPGSFSSHIYLFRTNGDRMMSVHTQGDSYAAKGYIFNARSYATLGMNNDRDDYVYTVDRLFKFDAEGYEIAYPDSNRTFSVSSFAQTMAFDVYYVTKKDGTNWTSQVDMNNGKIEDLDIYAKYSDIPEGKVCVGLYFESKSGYLRPTTTYDISFLQIPLKIKETAVIGKTYGMTQTSKYWRENLNREEYSQILLDSYSTYPKTCYSFQNQNYIKTEYDADGNIIPGTHSGGYIYGQTVLVVGASPKISQIAVDADNIEKKNYDISKNQNVVTYKLTPRLISFNNLKNGLTDITITITDILPDGLTYIPGSCNYGEPDVINNENGTTELVWQINNCEVDTKIDDLTFKASIFEDTPNGTQYVNRAIISADAEKVGNTPIVQRESEYTIQVINLSSHRLYKIDTTPVIEKNGEIHYTLSYKNNTDEVISDFQLLDILPYNGDSRGTEYTGTYTLDRVIVTQEGTGGSKQPNDNLEILYTNDANVRNSTTCKDENLGDGWSEILAENVKQSATAIALKGEVGAQGKVTIDIYLKTNLNKGLDKYVNNATAQVYKETEQMTTSNVATQVVERKIEGIAWEDKNANGIKDKDEEVFKNVEITLANSLGEQVIDVNGNIVTPVRTDENGYYMFENLPRESYYVRVAVPSPKYELTEKEVGSNSDINSKFDVEAKETEQITKLDSLDLPKLTVSNVNAGLVKKKTKVIVNYKEVGTESILHEEVTIDGRIDDTYKTEDKIDEINEEHENKYKYVRVDGNTTGTMTEDTIYITYWYDKKDTNVKVLHVKEGTDVSSPESVKDVLYPTEEQKGKVDSNYTTQNRLEEINNSSKVQYELVTDEVENKNGKMQVETIYVVYEYRTIPAKVKVNHLELNTNNVLYAQETLDGLVGNDYNTQNRLNEINSNNSNKYELVIPEPENKNGVYKKEEQTIAYYYQKKMAEIEVNYLEVGTEKVLSDKVKKSDRIDEAYTTENKLDSINEENADKYEFVRVDGNIEGVYTLEKQVITYYYQKKVANVKILHVEEGTDVTKPESVTDVLYPTEEIAGRVDDTYETVSRLNEINAKNKIEYELVSVTDNASGNMTLDTIYVIYVYKKVPSKIVIKHMDIDSNEDLIDPVTRTNYVGEDYKTEDKLKDINMAYEDKYELVSEPENKDGIYKKEEQEIIYYYQKKQANVVVKYVDIDTEKELIEGEKIQGKVDDEYTTVDKIEEINENNTNKYVLVNTTENVEGKMTLEEIEVVYYYKKVEAQVVVKYVDEKTGEEIAKKEYLGGYVGDKYETSEKEIDGYELVLKKMPENKNGVYEENTIEVIYYYSKIPEPVNTGDIAVIILTIIFVASIVNITFVLINKKQRI